MAARDDVVLVDDGDHTELGQALEGVGQIGVPATEGNCQPQDVGVSIGGEGGRGKGGAITSRGRGSRPA